MRGMRAEAFCAGRSILVSAWDIVGVCSLDDILGLEVDRLLWCGTLQDQAWVVQVTRNLMSFVARITMVDTLLAGGRWLRLRVECGSSGDAGAVAVAGRRIRGRAR